LARMIELQEETVARLAGLARFASAPHLGPRQHPPMLSEIKMGSIPNKIEARIIAGLKRFQPILAAAKSRDVNESDTVVIVTDVLSEIFGYDKYSEITREYAIRGTYCDVAIKLDGRLTCLVEVKAIGLDLKDAFVKQAVDYAANQGVDWVLLTNGLVWRAYKVIFGKPIAHELVVEFNLLEMNPRTDSHIALLHLLSKEGWQKARLAEHHSQKEALSRFTIAALLMSDPLLDVLRRELRRVSPNVRVETSDVCDVLTNEVLKRDVLEGEKAVAAKKVVARAAAKTLRQSRVAPSTVTVPMIPLPEPTESAKELTS
jgi:predicted type IV restriction endonuclease